jgi:hypothetical protein
LINNVNDASCHIDVFISDGYCLQSYHACSAGKGHRHAGAILRQQNQLLRQPNKHMYQQNNIKNQADAGLYP